MKACTKYCYQLLVLGRCGCFDFGSHTPLFNGSAYTGGGGSPRPCNFSDPGARVCFKMMAFKKTL